MYPTGRLAKVTDNEPGDDTAAPTIGKSRMNPKNRKIKSDTALELDKTYGQRSLARSANSFKFWRQG